MTNTAVFPGGNARTLGGRFPEAYVQPRGSLTVNSNFSVNQRGQQEYTAAGYTVDGWRLSGGGRLKVENSGVSLAKTEAAGDVRIQQAMEFPQRYAGKTLTATIRYKAVTPPPPPRGTFRIGIGTAAGEQFSPPLPPSENWNTVSFEADVPDGSGVLYCMITGAGNAGDAIQIAEMKLEVGKGFTGFYPKQPQEEWADCQRFQLPIYHGQMFAGRTDSTNEALVFFSIPTPSTLRAVPAMVQNGSSTQWRVYNQNGMLVAKNVLRVERNASDALVLIEIPAGFGTNRMVNVCAISSVGIAAMLDANL